MSLQFDMSLDEDKSSEDEDEDELLFPGEECQPLFLTPPRPASVPAPATPPRRSHPDMCKTPNIFDMDGFTPEKNKYPTLLKNIFEDYVNEICSVYDIANYELDEEDLRNILGSIPNYSFETKEYIIMLKEKHNSFFRLEQEHQRLQQQLRRQRRQRRQRPCEDEEKSDTCTPGCQVSLHQLRF